MGGDETSAASGVGEAAEGLSSSFPGSGYCPDPLPQPSASSIAGHSQNRGWVGLGLLGAKDGAEAAAKARALEWVGAGGRDVEGGARLRWAHPQGRGSFGGPRVGVRPGQDNQGNSEKAEATSLVERVGTACLPQL